MYIGDSLGRREIYSPMKLAIVDVGQEPELRLTYQQWNQRVKCLANWFRNQAAIAKGDRVAILARDGIEHLDCFYACGKLGAIHTALNWRLHWRETASLISDTQPKVLLYSTEFSADVAKIAAISRSQNLKLNFFLHLGANGISGSVNYVDALKSSPDTAVTCETLGKEDIACLLFTGGTTGLPKGAKISHRQIQWNVLNTIVHDLDRDDKYLNVFPLFHAGGLFAYTSSQIVFGNTTIITKMFDPELILSLIEREQVTVFAGVPTMFQMMTQAPNWETADLSSLRFCTSGGAPLPVPLVKQYEREKGVRFKQGFGMTEYGPGLFALPASDSIRKAGSIGRPNFFVDVRVVDEANSPLGPGSVGELVLKGPSGFSGYWNNPEASAEVIDDKGWFHTGDLVTYDEEWYFTVVDRKKDMFISGGENIYPAEIEAVLYQHPAVHMCAVVGVPDDKWGEVGKACIVPKPDQEISEEEVIEFLQDNLARYKVPKHLIFMDALPISGAGKILKRELRNAAIEQS